MGATVLRSSLLAHFCLMAIQLCITLVLRRISRIGTRWFRVGNNNMFSPYPPKGIHRM